MNKHVNKVRKATGRAEAITAGRQQKKQQYLIIQLLKKKERLKNAKTVQSKKAVISQPIIHTSEVLIFLK